MDKKLMLAVAGSGKTTYLINKLSEDKRALILTYTNNNERNIQSAILKKFGYHPKGIYLFKYYTFIYSFCYRPLLSMRLSAKGINFKPNLNRFAKGDARFIDDLGRLYSNRITSLLANQNVLDDIRKRVEKYFDAVYIDEVQDFAGNDFNFLKTLAAANREILFVGDFFQHTYDTSRDGNVNASLHESETKYVAQFQQMGLVPDNTTLGKSHRCNPEVCDFVKEHVGIDIGSHRTGGSEVIVVRDQMQADKIYSDANVVKLFYQAHYHYDCYSRNWGESKGEDHYDDVCVVLNDKTWGCYQSKTIKEMAAQTKSKLYVAITRAKGNLYLVPESLIKKHKKID